MEIIKQLVTKIDDELEDAEKYIDCAYKVKDKYPSLADVYYKLSIEEMNHMTILHAQVVNIINEYKKTNEVPVAMQAVYDYLHDKQIEWSTKIKIKQTNYK
jgi:rubrerythrin